MPYFIYLYYRLEGNLYNTDITKLAVSGSMSLFLLTAACIVFHRIKLFHYFHYIFTIDVKT